MLNSRVDMLIRQVDPRTYAGTSHLVTALRLLEIGKARQTS
jgi:hypothetical protein